MNGPKRLYQLAVRFHEKGYLQPLWDFLLFAFILLVMHVLYRYWVNILHFQVFGLNLNPKPIHQFLISHLVEHSSWATRNLLGIDHFVEGRTLRIPPNAYVEITQGCSGFKPMYQVIGIFLLFRGPWIPRIWFIPLALLVVHLTNVIRISGLAWAAVHVPQYWDGLHDWFFRPLFYVNIILLWVWWLECFVYPNDKK